MSLVPVDASSELAVTSYLQKARDWLAQAVETTGPEQIATAKAEIATAAEATKQLGLSKEIQLDAQEMVRRAEFAVRKAASRGQAEGTVRSHGATLVPGARTRGPVLPTSSDLPSPKDFFTTGTEYEDANAMGALTEAEFETVLTDAREDGDMSRAAVARRARQASLRGGVSRSSESRDQRADLITKLANEGYSSRQMPAKVGVSEEVVRRIARDYGIEIPADRSVSRTRRINSTQIVVNTATALEGLVSGIELVDIDALDLDEASQWAASLTDSTRKLARFAKQIREATQ